MQNPFRYFNNSPEIIRLAVMMYVRYPLSLRQVEDLLFERGIGEKERSPNSEPSRSGQTFAAALAEWRQLPACGRSIVGLTGSIQLV